MEGISLKYFRVFPVAAFLLLLFSWSAPPALAAISPAPSLTSSLFTGVVNPPEVYRLQLFLVSKGLLNQAVFIPGNFDTATYQAITAYQCSQGIVCAGSPGYGIVGPRTRAVINGLGDVFVRALSVGNRGTDVQLLQLALKNLGYFATKFSPTQYFGTLSRQVLLIFQKDHHLTVSGSLDLPTRTLLNQMVAADPTLIGRPALAKISSTFSVLLTATPSMGVVSQAITLTASVVTTSTAQATTTFTFYCNRSDASKNITLPANLVIKGSTSTVYVARGLCSYTNVGSYVAKVIAQRGSLPVAESRAAITITSGTDSGGGLGNGDGSGSGTGGGGGGGGGGNPPGGSSDTIPPTVSIAAPAINATLSGVSTVTISASDNVSVTGVQLKLDGANLGPLLTSAPYTYQWNTAAAANGNHTLSASATDPTGNSATSPLVTVVVSNPFVVSSPAANQRVSGAMTFSVNQTTLPIGTNSVEYLINGRQLYNSGEPIAPLGSAPYSLPWQTVNSWDGYMTIQAVAKDAGGNVLATSAGVPFQIANGTTTLSLLSPDPSQTLSGTVNWTLQTNFPSGQPAKIFSCYVDGKGFTFNFRPESTATYALDTTQYPNGQHDLACGLFIEGNGSAQAIAFSDVSVQFNNGHAPMELRSNFGELNLIPGETVTLSPKLAYTDSVTAATTASFTSGNSGVVTVSSGGLVTAVASGVTTITLTSGSRTASVRVIVNSSHIAPQFSSNGDILNSYIAGSSTFLTTMYFLNADQFENYPSVGSAVSQAGVNAITTGFYYNPTDSSGNPNDPVPNNFNQWLVGENRLLSSIQNGAASNSLNIFLTGDDIARSNTELYNSVVNASSAAKIQYALTWMKNTNHTVGIDMVDEIDALWGATPTPTDGRWLSQTFPIPDNAFTTLMGIVNGVPGRSPISYPPTGAANSTIVQNWQGNPAFSDFATMYWTFSGNFWEQLYPWSFSINQTIENIDRTLEDRLAVMQRNKPLLLLVSATGPYYQKLGPGNQYTPGQDYLFLAGNSPETIGAQIMYAIAKGFSGVRVYGFEPPNNTFRQNDVIGGYEQTFASPAGTGVGRWQAMSTAFNLIKNISQYILQPQANAPDLGSGIYTGVRSGSSGRLIIAINSLETQRNVTIDLSPYLYGSGSVIQRYRVGLSSSNTSLPTQSASDSLTLNPGESAVWVIHQ